LRCGHSRQARLWPSPDWSQVAIGETLADPDHPVALPVIQVDEPTVRMSFGVNSSPLAGAGEPLEHLAQAPRAPFRRGPAQRLAAGGRDRSVRYIYCFRPGELHLAILIETMRREGYEFQVFQPESDPASRRRRPDPGTVRGAPCPRTPRHTGAVVEMLGRRRGEMINMMDASDGSILVSYHVPTRGLLGFRYQFLTVTRGMGTMDTLFYQYGLLAGPISSGRVAHWLPGKPASPAPLG